MVLAGGLAVIYSRVLLDAVAWIGLSYSIWTPPTWKNSTILLATIWMMLATCGLTSRWPLTFPTAPIVAFQILRRLGSKLHNSSLLRYLSLLFVLVSVGVSVLFPPLQLPRAQAGGPYAVGAVDFFLPIQTNTAENETCSLFNHTHVKARLFYPSNSTDSTMPYLSPSLAMEFLQESMNIAAPPELKAYGWLLHHWLLTELPVQKHGNLIPSSQQEAFPLVVYSHGLLGNADIYSYQAVSLASQGLLVLMVNHLDGSAPVAEHHDGSRVMFDQDLVQVWHDGKKVEYVRERRRRTEWRAMELLGATDSLLALNNEAETPSFWQDAPHLSLKGRIQTNRIFFMGHSFGGATAFTAAYRRPELIENGGAVVAHEPVIDWLPDDVRRSILPLDRLEGLESSHNYTGGMGGLEYHTNTTTDDGPVLITPETCLHEMNFLMLFSSQWREELICDCHIFEEMHQKGRLGPKGGVTDYGIIPDMFHNEFSDMSMLTPLWLARGAGATGPRNPVDTAREIEERTWKFVSSVLNTKLDA